MKLSLLFTLAAALCAQDRVEYPHSITPGGLQPGFLRLYPHRDMVAWVNYRGDDGRIHWTDKQVSIPERETVLVDRYGNLYRGRCGNNITLFGPKEFVPPAPPDLDTPHAEIPIPPEIAPEPWSFAFELDFGPELGDDLPLDWPFRTPPPPNSLPAQPGYPPAMWWPGGYSWSAPLPGPVRASVVPEPSTGSLLGFALTIAYGIFCVVYLELGERRRRRIKAEAEMRSRNALRSLKMYWDLAK